jgi:hypothetical protein
VAAPSNSRLGRVATPSSSRLGRVATVGVAARPPSRYSWPLQQLEVKGSLCSPEGSVHLANYRCLDLRKSEVSDGSAVREVNHTGKITDGQRQGLVVSHFCCTIMI